MKRICLIIISVLAANQALARPNPAAVYCELLGYEYKKIQTPSGEKGFAVIEPGVQLDAWDFFKGKVGNEYAFGALYGYDTECVRTNIGTCVLEYAVCVPKGQKNNKRAARIPLLEFMEQKGVPLLEKTGRGEKRASSGAAAASREEDIVAIYDIMAQGKTLPTSFDWRAYNGHTYIGSIRDQGSCGSCYAFAAAAAAEGTYNWAMGKYGANCSDFSESFIIWCLGRLSEYSSHFYGCDGADWDYAELTALTSEGICSETDFPYTITDPGSCTHWSDPVTVFTEWHRIPCSDIDAIKTAIMTYGGVDAAVDTTSSFDSYSSGIYSDTSTNCPESPCYMTSTDHAIALVGWDDNPPEGGGGCWILRNSWNTGWGEGGYMRIRYNAARVACEACYLVYLGTNTHTLAVASLHGGAYPATGIMTNNHGVSITCYVTNSPVIGGTTQFVCTGWSGAGSVPAAGSGTNTGPFTLTNDSTITWQWQTNFYLHIDTNGCGTVDRMSGWQALGSNVTAIATPASLYHFAGWSGDTSDCSIAGNQITIPMSRPRSVTACFAYESLSAPMGVSASDGTFSDKVLMAWNAVVNASGYLVWRGGMNTTNSAALIGSGITTTNYSDTTAVADVIYYYWVKATNASDISSFSVPDSGWRTGTSPAVPTIVSADFDGDGKADPALYVTATGVWYVKLSGSSYGLVTLSFGGTGYTAVEGDFDGDGKADPAIYQTATGNWSVQLSGSGYVIATLTGFGGSSCDPVAGDYDGDGKADPATYNTTSGDWLVAMSSMGYGTASATGFGGAAFAAVQENYDSDNRFDAAIYNTTNGNWTILLSAQNYITATLWYFGGNGYDPIQGDFDGDGLADLAIYQESTGNWAVKLSGSSYATATLTGFGGPEYGVLAADFDGDGKADPTLFDETTGLWHIKLSASSYTDVTLASGYEP